MAGQGLGNISLAALMETLLLLPHSLAFGKRPRKASVTDMAVSKGGRCEAASLAVGRACFWPWRCAEQPESTA